MPGSAKARAEEKTKTAEKKKGGRPQKLPLDFRRFALRLPADLHRRIRYLAVDAEMSINDLILHVLEEYWDKHPNKALYEKLLQDKG